jgi:DNA-binding SARP family transcriptional activator
MDEPLMLHARLLGSLDLRLGDKSLPALDSARAESLLAYLLLHRDAPQPRQRLAFLLWPDSTETQARTNLRKVLHVLRHALPDPDRLIETGQRTVRWRADAPLWLDVAQFERALAEERLEDAVEIYAGDLLEGNYDEWLLEERDRLAHMHLDALDRLSRLCERQERWPDAIRFAERLVAQDPLREESHRQLIRLCRAAGDRARALRAYHVCAATLERELAVEPSAVTRTLYEEILDDAPGGSASTSPFVGRADELATLRALWRDAASGRAQLVLVSGEPGIGKTRLVDELRRRSEVVALEARAYPAEGTIAYAIAVAWLRSDAVTARLTRLDRVELSELARLLPELAAQVAPPEPLSEAEFRRRLFGAVGRALLAAGSPLLLIVDDAHWADEQSLRLIHYLLRAAPSARLLVAVTARREELDAGHPLGELVTSLQTADRVREISLRRLNRAETALLVNEMRDPSLTDAEIERLYADSEGNPLFIVETLRSGAPAAATRVQAVIASRLARLSPPAAELTGTAAAIGRSFGADMLAAASDLDERALVNALDELWRRGIVRAQGPGTYDFSHGRIRDAAYSALSPPRRRATHLAIAGALVRSGNAAPAVLAAQYEAAGATAEALRWHERAAQAAQWLHAHADAVRSLERALALSSELQPGPETAALQLRLLTALPAPLLALEGYGSPRIKQIHTRASALAAQLAIDPEPPLVWSFALAALTTGDWELARGSGELLRARAEQDDDQILWVESDYILGIAAYWPGRLEEARAHFEAAMRRFRPGRRRAHMLRYGQDPELIVRTRLAHTLWLLGYADEADHQRDLAVQVADDSAHAYSRAVARTFAAILAADRDDVDGLRAQVAVLRTYPTDDVPAQVRLPTEVFVGHLDVLDGRTAAGLARERAVHEQLVGADAPAPGVPGLAARVLLKSYAVAGDSTAGLALADQALVMGRGAELWEAEIRRLRAVFLAALGASHEEVSAELEHALAVARHQGARAFEQRIRETLAERSLSHDRAP